MRPTTTLRSDAGRRGVEALFLIVALMLDVRCVNDDSNCAAQTRCDGCAALPSCGWCASTRQCVTGNHTGPSAGSCAMSWVWSQSSCAVADACAGHSTCETCAGGSTPDRYTTCRWWVNAQQCVAVSNRNPPPPGLEVLVSMSSACIGDVDAQVSNNDASADVQDAGVAPSDVADASDGS